jgi:hypothetical protein
VSVGLALGRSRSPIVFRLSADESRQGHRARDLGVAPALAKQRHDTLTVEPSDASSPGRAWRCVVAYRTGIAPPPCRRLDASCFFRRGVGRKPGEPSAHRARREAQRPPDLRSRRPVVLHRSHRSVADDHRLAQRLRQRHVLSIRRRRHRGVAHPEPARGLGDGRARRCQRPSASWR